MRDNYHEAAVVACGTVLRPLIDLLLRNGLSFKEFCSIAKEVFVEVALKNKSGKLNISDIAIKTGISRKGVKQALTSSDSTMPRVESPSLYYIKVLEVWHTDRRYLDENNKPVKLAYIDDQSVSLLQLISGIGVDVPPSAILKDLISSGIIDIDENGLYFPKDRSAIKQSHDPHALVHSGAFLAAHAKTILRNISDDQSSKLFERQTFTFQLHENRVEEFEKTSKVMCRRYLSEMEDYLVSISDKSLNDRTRVLGMGIYVFNNEVDKQLVDSFSNRT